MRMSVSLVNCSDSSRLFSIVNRDISSRSRFTPEVALSSSTSAFSPGASAANLTAATLLDTGRTLSSTAGHGAVAFCAIALHRLEILFSIIDEVSACVRLLYSARLLFPSAVAAEMAFAATAATLEDCISSDDDCCMCDDVVTGRLRSAISLILLAREAFPTGKSEE